MRCRLLLLVGLVSLTALAAPAAAQVPDPGVGVFTPQLALEILELPDPLPVGAELRVPVAATLTIPGPVPAGEVGLYVALLVPSEWTGANSPDLSAWGTFQYATSVAAQSVTVTLELPLRLETTAPALRTQSLGVYGATEGNIVLAPVEATAERDARPAYWGDPGLWAETAVALRPSEGGARTVSVTLEGPFNGPTEVTFRVESVTPGCRVTPPATAAALAPPAAAGGKHYGSALLDLACDAGFTAGGAKLTALYAFAGPGDAGEPLALPFHFRINHACEEDCTGAQSGSGMTPFGSAKSPAGGLLGTLTALTAVAIALRLRRVA